MHCGAPSAGVFIPFAMAFLSFWLMKPGLSPPELGILPNVFGNPLLLRRTLTQIVNREAPYRHPQLSLWS